MKRTFGGVVASLVVLVVCRCSLAMPVEAVPDPQRTGNAFVADTAMMMGPEWADLIDRVAAELKTKTGVELAVVTVDDLEGAPVEDYAAKLFSRFGIGRRGENDGLLLLCSRDDRKVRIEVGYGLEGIINDAKAGRLLDEYAIPRFRDGDYARGLFDTARALARLVAESKGVVLEMVDPLQWPAQVEVPKPSAAASSATSRKILPGSVGLHAAAYVGGVAGIVLLGCGMLWLRIRACRARAGRTKALGTGAVIPVLVWGGGGIATILVGVDSQRVFAPFLAYAAVSILATLLHIKVRKAMREGIAAYRPQCPQCAQPMRIIGEQADDQYLTKEEAAEEFAGGMDYECWRCDGCDRLERFAVKQGGADKCPKCKRRTLTIEQTTLEEATTSHAGKERVTASCANPGCSYTKSDIRTIAKKSSSSGGGFSSGGSSGGGSFGGGSSGGGGASRGW